MDIRKTAQNLIALSAAGLAVFFAESIRELNSFRAVRYPVHIPGLEGIRLLFVTDYHEAVKGKLNPGILEAARKLKPDAVLIGGDLVNGKKPFEDVTPSVELINGLAKTAPVVHAFGNHECRFRANRRYDGYDWDGYMARLDKRVLFLENQETVLQLKGRAVRIYGLNVDRQFYTRHGMKLTAKDVEGYLGIKDTSCPTILLAHDPSWFEAYTGWGAELTLSGHYHGGIIRLPVIGGLVNPKMQLLPKYDYGIYEKDDRRMLVSSGLGQHTLPARWFNMPELVVIDLI